MRNSYFVRFDFFFYCFLFCAHWWIANTLKNLVVDSFSKREQSELPSSRKKQSGQQQQIARRKKASKKVNVTKQVVHVVLFFLRFDRKLNTHAEFCITSVWRSSLSVHTTKPNTRKINRNKKLICLWVRRSNLRINFHFMNLLQSFASRLTLWHYGRGLTTKILSFLQFHDIGFFFANEKLVDASI